MFNITIGGSMCSVATQVSTTVTWRLSDFVCTNGNGLLTFLINMSVLEGTMSKYAGVSSMLAINLYGTSAFVRHFGKIVIPCVQDRMVESEQWRFLLVEQGHSLQEISLPSLQMP